MHKHQSRRDGIFIDRGFPKTFSGAPIGAQVAFVYLPPLKLSLLRSWKIRLASGGYKYSAPTELASLVAALTGLRSLWPSLVFSSAQRNGFVLANVST